MKKKRKKIQDMANTIVLKRHNIIKSFIDKGEEEKKYGFTLYQGGVVP